MFVACVKVFYEIQYDPVLEIGCSKVINAQMLCFLVRHGDLQKVIQKATKVARNLCDYFLEEQKSMNDIATYTKNKYFEPPHGIMFFKFSHFWCMT